MQAAFTSSASTSPKQIIQTNNIAHNIAAISAAISIIFVPNIVVNNKIDNK